MSAKRAYGVFLDLHDLDGPSRSCWQSVAWEAGYMTIRGVERFGVTRMFRTRSPLGTPAERAERCLAGLFVPEGARAYLIEESADAVSVLRERTVEKIEAPHLELRCTR